MGRQLSLVFCTAHTLHLSASPGANVGGLEGLKGFQWCAVDPGLHRGLVVSFYFNIYIFFIIVKLLFYYNYHHHDYWFWPLAETY